MPTYVFKRPSGRIVEAFMESSEVCRIGEYAEIDGAMCLRLVTLPQVKKPPNYYHTSRLCDPWDPKAPRHDKEGNPVFTSKHEVDEYAAKTGRTYGQS